MSIHMTMPDLLEAACPSIQYRIRSEILGESLSSRRLRQLQQEIIQDPTVQAIFDWQQPDGWLAWDFHRTQSTETGIRLPCEKGVSPRHPVVKKALRALETHSERLDRGVGKAGKVMDDRGFGGAEIIRAAVFAYAGHEEQTCVEEQIPVALAGLRAVTEIQCLDELAEPYRGKWVYRPGVRWPGIYHLRLLAFTHRWRTAQNRRIVTEAVRRLVDLSPLPQIYVRNRSQLIAPASFAMQDFDPDMNAMDAPQWMMWFHRMECLARIGVIHQVPELHAQACALSDILHQGNGQFLPKLHHVSFTKWGAYTGLMLEQDWRSPQRRINDLTFRALLILHYARTP